MKLCRNVASFKHCRPIATINLDPANNTPVFEYDADISELITLDDVMDAYKLGPNGGTLRKLWA
jgi:hypothetical protein